MPKSRISIIKGANLYLMVLTQYGVKVADASAKDLAERLKEGGLKVGKEEKEEKE